MKYILILLLGAIFSVQANAQHKSLKSAPDPSKKIMIVEASCGECQFHMKGKGCDLAIRYEGKSYFVDGTSIDDHGDAHGADGFCEAIRKAEVQGEVKDGRFKASYFKLKPLAEEKSNRK